MLFYPAALPLSSPALKYTHARLRGVGERANVQLKTWRILRPR
jgi:hypothetical protein